MSRLLTHYANLHMHSTHSDGRYSPDELARLAKEIGYGAIALTDHDTVSGNPIMKRECERLGLGYVYGSEFYARLEDIGRIVHLVGFGFDPDHPQLREHIRKMGERYSTQTKQLFERALAVGEIRGVTWDEVLKYNEGISWLVFSHVFNTMKAKGLVDDSVRDKLKETSFSSELKRQLTPTCGYPNVRDMIRYVHEAGGIMLFAHPHELLDYVEILAGEGLDGLEVWHSELDGEERRRALALAKKCDLFVSGGDDHSGLLGGQYYRFEKPEETRYFFPPRSLGVPEFFYEEISDMKKKSDRRDAMDELLSDGEIWEKIR